MADRRNIDPTKFDEVVRLLGEGTLSQVTVAARVGVGRQTVARIYEQYLCLTEEERTKVAERLIDGGETIETIARRTYLTVARVIEMSKDRGKRLLHSGQKRVEKIQVTSRDAGTPRRCPECGGLVYMPCYLCYVRSLGRLGRSRRRV
jgi:predicted DNA-binding protein (UPF0251 family)